MFVLSTDNETSIEVRRNEGNEDGSYREEVIIFGIFWTGDICDQELSVACINKD